MPQKTVSCLKVSALRQSKSRGDPYLTLSFKERRMVKVLDCLHDFITLWNLFFKQTLRTFPLKYYRIYDKNLFLRTCQKKLSEFVNNLKFMLSLPNSFLCFKRGKKKTKQKTAVFSCHSSVYSHIIKTSTGNVSLILHFLFHVG